MVTSVVIKVAVLKILDALPDYNHTGRESSVRKIPLKYLMEDY